MFPELFEVPFIHITVKSYGFMMVVGFVLAVWLMSKMARRMNENPEHITNVALYALISGVVGARIFYVFHNFRNFKGIGDMLAVWKGGLEFLGGVILAIAVVLLYLYRKKLPIKKYVDIMATGLMLGLAFGRIGCLLNGCCFGQLCQNSPPGIHFPYGSYSYTTQVKGNPDRGIDTPYMNLPADYFGAFDQNGDWIDATEENKLSMYLKPFEMLTEDQKHQVTHGQYKALPVQPTQIYSTINALILCAILYIFWRKFGKSNPGATLGLMFILYGITRFLLEAIRDDNPFEQGWWAIYKGGTISQNISIYMIAAGAVFITLTFKNKSTK